MDYFNGCFVYLTAYLISSSTFNTGANIVCDTGDHVTSEVLVNFTVQEITMMVFGCLDGLDSEETISYPGSPESITYYVSVVNKSFTLLWKPPDDASFEQVTGFLLELFAEDSGDTYNPGPSACYLVQSKLASAISTGKDTQDAVFHLTCRMGEPSNVLVNVQSLPAPYRRPNKDVTARVTFKGTSTRQTTPLLESETNMIRTYPAEDHAVSMVAILLGVVVLSVLIMSIVCVVCKSRSHGYRITRSLKGTHQHDGNMAQERYHEFYPVSNTTSANNNDGIDISRADKRSKHCALDNYADTIITNDLSQNCTSKSNCSNGHTDISDTVSNRIHVPDINVKSISIPQEYRLQLQMINLDS